HQPGQRPGPQGWASAQPSVGWREGGHRARGSLWSLPGEAQLESESDTSHALARREQGEGSGVQSPSLLPFGRVIPMSVNASASIPDLNDSDILKIEAVLNRLGEKQSRMVSLEGFRKEAIERFAEAGFKVEA